MKIWHEVWDYIKMIIIVVAIVLVINNVVLINAKIPSPSMEKTIMTGRSSSFCQKTCFGRGS